MRKLVLFGLVIVCVVVVLVIVLLKSAKSAPEARQFDTVRVDYSLWLVDGTLIDTSNETVAREYGRVVPDKLYGPVDVTIGINKTLPG
ncbi:MAG: hypothetical protein ABIA93_03525, partial [Candidatus Woesearchaeota archaeon]